MNDKKGRLLYYSILTFVCISWLFPSFRIALFGSEAAGSAAELVVGLIPDLSLLFCVAVAAWSVKDDGIKGFLHSRPNKIFFWFYVTNIVLGIVLCLYPKLMVYGFRTTYLSMTFFLTGYAISKHRNLGKQVIEGVIHISLFFALLGLVLYFGFPDFVKQTIEKSGHPQNEYFIPRFTSVLWTPVLFAFIICMACTYFFYKAVKEGKAIDYIKLAFCWMCLFLTVSRGPMFAFLTVFIVIGVYYHNLRVIYALCAMTAGTLLLNYVVLDKAISLSWIWGSAVDTMSMEDDVSRVERWRLSWEAFMHRPMGYGMGRGGATAYRFLIDSSIPGAPYSTDGWYVKMLCENGVYGVLSSVSMAVYFLVVLIKKFRVTEDLMVGYAALLLILVAVHAVPSNTLDYHPFISFFWLVIGYSLNVTFTKENQQT